VAFLSFLFGKDVAKIQHFALTKETESFFQQKGTTKPRTTWCKVNKEEMLLLRVKHGEKPRRTKKKKRKEKGKRSIGNIKELYICVF
jgi:hypothetical protein